VTLKIFAQLVGAAVENARLHQHAALRLDALQKLQSELVERERLAALGEAAAVMAHEVRNPISAILNAVTLLERGSNPGASQAELHRVIAEEAERLERLVSDLLAVGRPLVPRVREADLADVAEATVAMLRTRHELEQCVIDPVVSEGATMAAIDPDLVELAVLNVLRNAVQASPRGGHVRVTVASRDDRVVLSVDDEGPGIDKEVARRMFEPFFTTRATGTGIGLAVVRRVVDASGGLIEIGRSPSGGGRISLVFPAFHADT